MTDDMLSAQRADSAFRLSPQQARLATLTRDADVYRTQAAVRASFMFEAAGLEHAVRLWVRRHAALRVRLIHVPGARLPLQQVVSDSSAPVTYIEAQMDERARRALAAEARARAANLEAGPTAWLHHLRDEAGDTLLLTLPAVVADARSALILLEDLVCCYRSPVEAMAVTAPDVLTTAAFFLELLDEEEEADDEASDSAFWRRMTAPREPLCWPLVRQAEGSPRPDQVEVPLTPSAARALRELGARARVPLEAALLSAFQTFAHRVTGQDELRIHVSGHARSYDELASAVGPLRRWLPLDVHRDERRPPTGQAATLNRALDEAREHELGLDPSEHASAAGLAFDYVARTPGEGLSFAYVYSFDAPHLLTCLCVDDGERLAVTLIHDQTRISQGLAMHWAGLLASWIEAVAHASERPVSSLPLVPAQAREAVLGGPWPALAAPVPFLDRFAAVVRRDPEAIAVASESGTRTYRDLAERSRRLARALRAAGLRPEEPVAVVLSRRCELVEVMLGILQAGGAYMPLDPALPTEALAYRVRDAGARVVLTERAQAAQMPEGPAVWCVDEDPVPWQDQPSEELAEHPHPGQLAYVLYTSGSSGRPKAVAVEHGNLAAYIEAAAQRLDLRRPARFAHVSTFAADLGHTGLFLPLATGGAVHVLDEEHMASASALAGYMSRHPVDFMKIAPSHLRVLLATSSERKVLPTQGLVLGGEALPWELATQLRALVPRLFNHYGPTETTVGSAMHAVDPAAARHGDTVPLGTPLAGERLYVLDERLAPVPAGVPGELFIAGRGVTRGYVGRAGLTASRFLPDPFAGEPGARMYRTGDRVYRLPDGAIVFLGRSDLQFKVRGFRVEPGEIEATLAAHPDVSRAVVVKWTRGLDERLVAYVVAERGRRPDPGELRRFAASRLASHLCPSSYVFLRALPLTANGKLDRAALPQPDAQRPELMTRFVAPASELEVEITRIWSDLLGVEQVGVDDNFFDLGGHSLLLVQLLSRLRERFHCELRVVELFQHSTVRALAQRITNQSHDGQALAADTATRATARVRARERGAERREAARTTGQRGGGSR